jgi:broad specificity phosphatase PhoE
VAQTRALGQSPHWTTYTSGTHRDGELLLPEAAADTSSAIAGVPVVPTFWRIYSSDLKRTRHTTQLLLDTMVPLSPPQEVWYDERIRELGKGVRQGYPKHWSYEQARDEYQKATERSNINGKESAQAALPLRETNEDGWKRALDWLQSVIDDIVALEQPTNSDTTDTVSTAADATNTCYTVLAVAHAGLLRVVLQRLLGRSRLAALAAARFDPNDQGRLAVPNTSLTVLDLLLDTVATLPPTPPPPVADPSTGHGQCIEDKEEEEDLANGILPRFVHSIDIVLFTSTDHLHVA